MFTIPKKPRKNNMNFEETKSDSFFKIDDVVSNIMNFVNVEDVLIPRTSKTLRDQFKKNKKKEKVEKKVKNLCMYNDTAYISVIYDEMSFYERNQFCIELIKNNNLRVFQWIRNRNDSKFLESYWRQKQLGGAALLSGNLSTIEYINRNHIHVALSVNKKVLIEIIRKGYLNVLEYLHELSVDFFSDEISSFLNEAILSNNLEIVTFFITLYKPIIVNITHIFSSIFIGNKKILEILLEGHIGRRKERLFEHAAVYLKLKGDTSEYNKFITDYNYNDIITDNIVEDCIYNRYDIRTIQSSATKLGNFEFLIELKKRHSHLNPLNWFKTYLKSDEQYIDVDILHKYFSDLISVENLVFFQEFSFVQKFFAKIENVEKDKITNKKILKHFLCNHDIGGIQWFFQNNLHIGLQKFNAFKHLLEYQGSAHKKIQIMNILYENNMKTSSSDIIYTIKNNDNPFMLFKWYIKKFGLSFEEDCFLVALKYGELDILKFILQRKSVFGFAQLKKSEEKENRFSYSGIPTWEKHKHICSFFSLHYGSYWKYNIEHVMEYLY
jgi:hypothetical protein